jgi:hypothetical protein
VTADVTVADEVARAIAATAAPAGRLDVARVLAANLTGVRLSMKSPEAGFTVGHDLVVDGGATP